jgi:hypothetical protein
MKVTLSFCSVMLLSGVGNVEEKCEWEKLGRSLIFVTLILRIQ